MCEEEKIPLSTCFWKAGSLGSQMMGLSPRNHLNHSLLWLVPPLPPTHHTQLAAFTEEQSKQSIGSPLLSTFQSPGETRVSTGNRPWSPSPLEMTLSEACMGVSCLLSACWPFPPIPASQPASQLCCSKLEMRQGGWEARLPGGVVLFL